MPHREPDDGLKIFNTRSDWVSHRPLRLDVINKQQQKVTYLAVEIYILSVLGDTP